MGIIQIEDMEFRGFHGCYKEEQVVGNQFLVNLSIETNMEKPSETDNIADALDYQNVYEIVKEQMSIKSHLLEHVAKRILDALYQNFEKRIKNVVVTIAKMNPPMGGIVKNVSVTLRR